jgi:hypothetical protein
MVLKSGLIKVGQKQMDRFSLVMRFTLLLWLTLQITSNQCHNCAGACLALPPICVPGHGHLGCFPCLPTFGFLYLSSPHLPFRHGWKHECQREHAQMLLGLLLLGRSPPSLLAWGSGSRAF